jgi:hypothetical protein
MPRNLNKIYIQGKWQQLRHPKATNIFNFGLTQIVKKWALKYWIQFELLPKPKD